MIDKLRELQEQASPGPWTAGRGELSYAVRALATFEDYFNEPAEANARLAALAPHLFPLAEALEESALHCNSPRHIICGEIAVERWYDGTKFDFYACPEHNNRADMFEFPSKDFPNGGHTEYAPGIQARKALTALQEALDE